MALVRKILETTLAAESTSVVFTDSDIPNSLLRVYTTKSDLFPLSQTISGNNLTVNYEAQTSNVGVALEIVKQGLTINDTLTSDATDQALSAKQGKALKTLIDGITVPSELTDLSDVDVTSIQDGQVLAWSDDEQKFVNVNQSGGTSSLDDLTDVDITTPTDGQALIYDASNSEWKNGSAGATSLNGLSDVSVTTPTNNQVLKYDSANSRWVNANESGGSGGSSVKITTSDSSLYGASVTLSDGTTTLTTTFSNSGEATFSGVTMTGDLTATCGVEVRTISIPYFGNYDIDFDQSTTEVTLTIYSAKEDTISYTDIDGATQTITFASGETSKQVQITIEPNGSSITFTSSVAKNPNDLSQDYSKTFTITTSTTDIYLMPDAVKTLYWYGYEGDIEDCINANGWTSSVWTLKSSTHNTNNISMSIGGSAAENTTACGVGSKTKLTGSYKVHFVGQSSGSGNYTPSVYKVTESGKTNYLVGGVTAVMTVVSNSMTHFESSSLTFSDEYISPAIMGQANYPKSMTLNALWYE